MAAPFVLAFGILLSGFAGWTALRLFRKRPRSENEQAAGYLFLALPLSPPSLAAALGANFNPLGGLALLAGTVGTLATLDPAVESRRGARVLVLVFLGSCALSLLSAWAYVYRLGSLNLGYLLLGVLLKGGVPLILGTMGLLHWWQAGDQGRHTDEIGGDGLPWAERCANAIGLLFILTGVSTPPYGLAGVPIGLLLTSPVNRWLEHYSSLRLGFSMRIGLAFGLILILIMLELVAN